MRLLEYVTNGLNRKLPREVIILEVAKAFDKVCVSYEKETNGILKEYSPAPNIPPGMETIMIKNRERIGNV